MSTTGKTIIDAFIIKPAFNAIAKLSNNLHYYGNHVVVRSDQLPIERSSNIDHSIRRIKDTGIAGAQHHLFSPDLLLDTEGRAYNAVA